MQHEDQEVLRELVDKGVLATIEYHPARLFILWNIHNIWYVNP